MKAAQTLQESLGNLAEVTTQGDLLRIVANGMLAFARHVAQSVCYGVGHEHR